VSCLVVICIFLSVPGQRSGKRQFLNDIEAYCRCIFIVQMDNFKTVSKLSGFYQYLNCAMLRCNLQVTQVTHLGYLYTCFFSLITEWCFNYCNFRYKTFCSRLTRPRPKHQRPRQDLDIFLCASCWLVIGRYCSRHGVFYTFDLSQYFV